MTPTLTAPTAKDAPRLSKKGLKLEAIVLDGIQPEQILTGINPDNIVIYTNAPVTSPPVTPQVTQQDSPAQEDMLKDLYEILINAGFPHYKKFTPSVHLMSNREYRKHGAICGTEPQLAARDTVAYNHLSGDPITIEGVNIYPLLQERGIIAKLHLMGKSTGLAYNVIEKLLDAGYQAIVRANYALAGALSKATGNYLSQPLEFVKIGGRMQIMVLDIKETEVNPPAK